jgi:hypothetical protein
MASAMKLKEDVTLRLLTDPRMRRVWQTIKERKIDPSVFDRVDSLQSLEKWGIEEYNVSLQDRASAAFFALVVIELVVEKPPLTKKRVADFVGLWSNGAKLCRVAMDEPGRGSVDPELRKALSVVAKYFDEQARFVEEVNANNPYVLRRSSGERNDDSVRAIVRALARRTHEIFGEYLCGTLTTVANVALQPKTDIKKESVVDWCAGLPVAIS